ncbi:hypothetical protein [uncultured Ferrovibrio sp.]|jgi:hypothetical protein|uniref:hypothetical protein n=1 Tax=uncultured Ferrovibrio sp. TaxID=1576913 RepID=UPI00262CC0F4|nr:hypothetical protein [uncultured Ferrovibrio sp.]
MCRWCDLDASTADLTPEQVAKQRQILQLLTLVEHPDALPQQDVLRIAQQIFALLDEIDDACADFKLARIGLPRRRDGLPPLSEFH